MLPDSLSAMASLLSSLPRQEALFVGEGAALPSHIKLKTLAEKYIPKSADIPFVSGWTNNPPSLEALHVIADRMTGGEED